jgi:hypothetical protein
VAGPTDGGQGKDDRKDTGTSRIMIWTRPDATSTTRSYGTRFGTQGCGDSPTGIAVATDSRTAWITENPDNRMVIWRLV